MSKTIREHIRQYIDEVGLARFETRDGVEGVLWLDENEWYPLSDAGLNQQLGFYRISHFPDVVNEAKEE